MYDGMPELVDYDDVVADLLMVDGLPQNRGSLHVHLFGLALPSADSCREDGRITNMRSPETRNMYNMIQVAIWNYCSHTH